MKIFLIIFLLMTACEKTEEVKTPKQDEVITHDSCIIESEKYSIQFKELICELRKSDINPDLKTIVLAQWIFESGRGSSDLAKIHYNFGGLKWRSEMKGVATPVSYKAHDGRTNYCKFESAIDFIKGYWAFIGRAPYKGWKKHQSDPENYLRFIVKKGYCPDNGYVNQVLSLQGEARSLLNN